MKALRLLQKKHFEESFVNMFSPKTYLNLCRNKGESSITEKSVNALVKIKSSGIFANDMTSSANEEAAYLSESRLLPHQKPYLFVYFDFVFHDLNFYHLFRKVWFFCRVCRKLSQQIRCLFIHLYTSLSIFFTMDSSWDPLFLLLDRCQVVIQALLQHKLSTTFQFSQCDQTATGIF